MASVTAASKACTRPSPTHRMAQHGLAGNQGEQLAGHEGAKTHHFTGRDLHPFRMRSRQAQHAVEVRVFRQIPAICVSSPRITSAGSSWDRPGRMATSIRLSDTSGRTAPFDPQAGRALERHRAPRTSPVSRRPCRKPPAECGSGPARARSPPEGRLRMRRASEMPMPLSERPLGQRRRRRGSPRPACSTCPSPPRSSRHMCFHHSCWLQWP